MDELKPDGLVMEKTKNKSRYQRYCESLGEPPKVVETFKDPAKLWGIQEDIVKHATGKGREAKHSVEKIYEVLAQNNIFVMESFDETLDFFNDDGRCVTSQSKEYGTVRRVLVGSVDYYKDQGMTESEARFYQWGVFGHELGHAIDMAAHPEITPWGTEIRQQMFSLKYAQVTGDHVTEQIELDFFKELNKEDISTHWS